MFFNKKWKIWLGIGAAMIGIACFVPAKQMMYTNASSSIEQELVGQGMNRIVYYSAVPGKEYTITVVKGKTGAYTISGDTILYFDQKTAQSTTVTFEFPLNTEEHSTVLLSSNDEKGDYPIVVGEINAPVIIEPEVPTTSVQEETTTATPTTATTATTTTATTTTATTATTADTSTTSPSEQTTVTTAFSVKAVLYGYDDVKVSWTKKAGVTGYYVYYKKDSAAYKYKGKTTNLTYKFSNLSDGVKYTFKVVPYKTVNKKTTKQNAKTVSIYTLKKIATPTVSKKSSGKITIKWKNINGESGYQIARSKYKAKKFKVIKTVNYKKSSITISVKKGQKYYYRIRAYKTVNGKKIYGPWSKVKSYKLK